mgnify:CR=1 FL=1
MYVLGLNIGHNATAALIKDGQLIACVSEERFSRIKNHTGIPFKSIEYVLSFAGIKIGDLDLIVLDDHYPIYKRPDFGKQFLEAYTKKTKKRRFLSAMGYSFPNLFKLYLNLREPIKINNKINFRNALKTELSRIFNFPREKVLTIYHHQAHAFSVIQNIPKNEKGLIFTLDGEGSGTCAKVSVFDKGNVRCISRTHKSASLGYLYAIATMYLGMKPLEHEFKVMGLAPYAKEYSVKKIYDELKKVIWIKKDLSFGSSFNMPFADLFFHKEMKYSRFDNIAGAVQRLTEDLTLKWIAMAIKKTGISRIALSGGVFMNVKANQKIAEMPEVKKIFVMPSCGDEANAIGCAIFGYKQLYKNKNRDYNLKSIYDLYLGPEYSDKDIRKFIEDNKVKQKYYVKKISNINKKIAQLLASGEIVARCSGRSEWGARALGNRSILANPSHPDTIKILNETIKDRDFWMHFTPSILDKFEKKYVVNPKKIFAPYMAITFNSTSLAKEHLPAAMHPYDTTLRPQVVTRDYNSDYYEIIEEFSKLTGIGGILNTSFNLHGEPNVLSPEDALHTVENSSLKYLAMGSYLLEKK